MPAEPDAVVNAEDRAYVDGIEDPALRAVVVASLLRHRAPERLRVGDRAPDACRLLDVEGAEPVELGALLGGRPVLLVFGSYT